MNLRFTHLIDCREYGDTEECCCLSLNPYQSELEIEHKEKVTRREYINIFYIYSIFLKILDYYTR